MLFDVFPRHVWERQDNLLGLHGSKHIAVDPP